MTDNIIYKKGRNWQLLLRKRIARLISNGWEPDEIAYMLDISKNIVEYHLGFINKDITALVVREK